MGRLVVAEMGGDGFCSWINGPGAEGGEGGDDVGCCGGAEERETVFAGSNCEGRG